MITEDTPRPTRPRRRSRRTPRALIAATAMLVVTAPLLLPPAAPPAAAQAVDFYTPPTPLGPGAPGQVIRSERFTANALLVLPLPAKAWRVMYRSTNATGRPVAVTGTVLVPWAPWRGPGPRPLVGIAAGTQGLADRCAVSNQLAAGTEYETAVIGQALLRGWAVAVTDYQGLGTPGDHTYVVGRALGRNVLDVMRAARKLPAAGLSPHGPAAVFGYSEGGAAASWAIQLQATYAPDLVLKAGVAGGVPADFNKLLQHIDGGPFAFLLLYSAIGFNAAYPELDLPHYLTPAGAKVADQLRNTCIQDAIAYGLLASKDRSYHLRTNPLATAAWQKRLRQNEPGFIPPRFPVLVGGARQDEVIPYKQNVLLYQRWCARGADAHFQDIAIGEHVTGGLLFAPPGLQFIADRFVGTPLSSDCRADQLAEHRLHLDTGDPGDGVDQVPESVLVGVTGLGHLHGGAHMPGIGWASCTSMVQPPGMARCG